MQVACGNCGASWEFDPVTIPPGGMSFACSQCSATVIASAAPPLELEIACNQCGLVYRFPPESIPAEGYEAQCTGCQARFFVSRTPGLAALPPVAAPAPAPPVIMPAARPVEVLPFEVPTAEPRAPEPLVAPVVTPVPAVVETSAPMEEDLMSLSAALGDPVGGVERRATEMEAEFVSSMKQQRRRLLLVGGALPLFVLLNVLFYGLAPSTWENTVGRLLGWSQGIAAEDRVALDAALNRLLDDTDAAYSEVIGKLDVLSVAKPELHAAAAVAAMARALHSDNAVGDANTQLRALRARASGDPEVMLAVGLVATLEPAAADVARAQLEARIAADKARTGAESGPTDPWTAYLSTRVATLADPTRAVASLSALVKSHPTHRRAQYELAERLAAAGQLPEARALCHEVVAAQAEHGKCRTLIKRIAEVKPVEAVPPAPAPAKPTKLAKKAKKKTR